MDLYTTSTSAKESTSKITFDSILYAMESLKRKPIPCVPIEDLPISVGKHYYLLGFHKGLKTVQTIQKVTLSAVTATDIHLIHQDGHGIYFSRSGYGKVFGLRNCL